ncbi:nuclease SbcCD subunit C [Kocuria varians]|uniref:Nuclease SbcCD subunit C n=1 Tax=Kocuria varians TaxID=1272 RepID=A0A4Y4D3S1_KOCVA|nr:SMC family ATPase [Kocuria varians]GEC99821.1 nuclease SbcCD subunit C [Kocuria varians]
MKVHRLEITAFGPFAGHEVVDFDLLNEAGVFLLNGETGAGKTSVLDAICFALYGSGPTTVGKGGRKAQHSDHAEPHTAPSVEVEFTAAGRRWCVTRSAAWREPSRRAASGWSDRHATVLLREYVDGAWIDRGYRPDDVGQTIHHAVGLDREQFTQVMMLPQGKFAQFLQAGSREREDLLETLFGTDVYAAVQDELKTRSDAAKSDLATARLEVERSEDLLSRLRTRLALTVDQLPVDAAATTAQASFSGSGTGPVPVSESAAGTGAASSDGSGESEGSVEEGEPSLRDRWRELVTECSSVTARVESTRDDAAAAHARAQQRVAEIEALSALVARHEVLTRRRAELQSDAERLDETVRRLEGHTAARELREPLAQAEGTREREMAARSAVERLRTALLTDNGEGWTFRDVLPDRPEVLDEARAGDRMPSGLRDAAVSAREAAKGVVARVRKLARDETILKADEERLRRLEDRAAEVGDRLRLLQETLTSAQEEQESLAAQVKDEALIRERARAARAAVEASREYARARAAEEEKARGYERAEGMRREAAHTVEALEARRYANAAASLASELRDGDPCPVCGSTSHPRVAAGGPEEDVTAGMLERARTERDSAQDATDAAHEQWQRAQQQSVEWLAHGASEDLEAVAEREQVARHAEEELDAAMEHWQRAQQRISEATAAVDELEAERSRIATESAGLQTVVETTWVRCAEEREQVSLLTGHFPSADALLRAAEDLVGTVSRWQEAQAELDAARQERRSSEDALARALERSPFTSEKEIAAALLDDREARELTVWVTGIRDETSSLEAELATADMRRVAGLGQDERTELSEESLHRAHSERDAAERRRDGLNRHLGGLEALAADARSHAHEAPSLEHTLEAAAERSARLAGLADVATANSSENSLRMTLTSFVLAAKLEHVAAVASEHLSTMSSGRFTLVHTDQARGGGKSGLGLEIDDAWTGVRRGTETLSGGESFFTSLALALALADVVRAEAGGTEIDTLFVDEGFGSLDEQTLEQVLETLDGLRRGGRVIGVVSHVSEMKQRIETQLVVTKTPQGSHLAVEAGPWGAHVG